LSTKKHDNNGMQRINEEQRRQEVIDFISEHQGCLAEDLVEDVKDIIGRGKVFNILKNLKDEMIVTEVRAKPNSRNIKLFVDKDNPLVIVPKKLDEFKQLFMVFLESIRKDIRSTVFMSNVHFKRFKKEMGKREEEKLSLDEIFEIFDIMRNDLEASTDLEELSLNLSKFVRTVNIFSKLIQTCIILSIFDWSPKIKDKDSFNRLLSIVYSEISNMQIKTAHVVNQAFHGLEFEMPVSFDISKVLRQAMNEQNDLEEIFEYYRLMDLEDEVKPLIEYLSDMNKDLPQSQDNLPLDKILPISPSEWTAETVNEFLYHKEYSSLEEYYAEQLQEEEYD
jgi:hypothetical protein